MLYEIYGKNEKVLLVEAEGRIPFGLDVNPLPLLGTVEAEDDEEAIFKACQEWADTYHVQRS